MFSAFRIGPADSGRGLCGIDSLHVITVQKKPKNIKKLRSPSTSKLNRLQVNRFNFIVKVMRLLDFLG